MNAPERRLRTMIAAVAATIATGVGLDGATAAAQQEPTARRGATAASCSSAERARREAALAAYKKRIARERAAYFRTHPNQKQRSAFVRRQQARLKALRRAAACTVEHPVADLAVAITATPDPADVNADVTLTISVSNAGPNPSEAAVSLELPAQTSLVQVTTPTGSCSASGTVCNLRTIDRGAHGEITVVLRTTQPGSFSVSARVFTTEDTIDPDASNNTAAQSFNARWARATSDRPDDTAAPQIHAMYVLPRDGSDRALDRTGAIASSVAAFERWLSSQTGGRALRLDTAAGSLDVTFVRLGETDAEISSRGPFVRDAIEAELHAAGFDAANKVYAVYYDGRSTWSCGGGAWPPTLPGNVAAMYLKGEPPGAPPCASNALATPGAAPGYLEFGMLHEIMHTLGFVATCAPHHTRAGHVSDDARDLMWAGDQPWQLPAILDVGHDDYYGHANSGCPDLAASPYLT